MNSMFWCRSSKTFNEYCRFFLVETSFNVVFTVFVCSGVQLEPFGNQNCREAYQFKLCCSTVDSRSLLLSEFWLFNQKYREAFPLLECIFIFGTVSSYFSHGFRCCEHSMQTKTSTLNCIQTKILKTIK